MFFINLVFVNFTSNERPHLFIPERINHREGIPFPVSSRILEAFCVHTTLFINEEELVS